MMIVIQSVQKKELFFDCLEVKLPSLLQEFLALPGVHDHPRDVKRAGHPRKQKPDLAISLFIVRARYVFRFASDVLDQKVEKHTAYLGGTPGNFRGQGRDRTALCGVVTMLKAQVAVDEGLQLTAFRSILDSTVRVMCQLLQPLLESRDEQLLLAEEVPVKPAVGQMEIPHQIADPSSFAATAAEPASRGLHDFFSSLLLVFRRVAHRRPL